MIKGKAFKFGDNIDTDAIISAKYLVTTDPKELAKLNRWPSVSIIVRQLHPII